MSRDETTILSAKISKLEDEVKKVVRRQNEIQKSVDLLFQNSEILEDMQASIQALKEIILQNQQRQDNARGSLQADVRAVGEGMEDVKTTLSDKTIIVKTGNKNIFNRLIKLFKNFKKEGGDIKHGND